MTSAASQPAKLWSAPVFSGAFDSMPPQSRSDPPHSAHDRLRPRETNPGDSQRTTYPQPPIAQIRGTDLQLSFGCFTNSIADLFLLIMLCVMAIFAPQNDRTSNVRMVEISVRHF